MKRLALLLVLLNGCYLSRSYYVAAGVNTAAVAGAAICAEECHGAAAGISDGILATEIAASAALTMAIAVAIVNSGGL